MVLPRVLSIAGTDPSGGAGASADIKSIQAAGGFALSVITAVVSQNTQSVRRIDYLPLEAIASQLAAVTDDVNIDAVKIGMLGNVEYIDLVRQWLICNQPKLVVLDPVMVATSGDRLLDARAESNLVDLCRLVDIITPNTAELEVLAGLEQGSITDLNLATEHAMNVASDLGVVVSVKAGHLDDPTIVNRLVDGSQILAESSSTRVDTRNTHGTGCSMSAALATRICVENMTREEKELDQKLLKPALGWVTDWLHESIVAAADLKVGNGNGPIDHSARNRRLIQAAANDPWWPQTINIAGFGDNNQELAGSTADKTTALSGQTITDPIPVPNNVPEPTPPVEVPPAGDWTKLLAQLSEPIVAKIWQLPFIERLREGTLSRWDFTAYQRQDSLYLDRYAKALATLAGKTDNASETAHWAGGGAVAVEVEQSLHRDWLAKANQPDLVGLRTMPITPITANYTDYLLARTSFDPYPVGVCAVLPCFWIYANIGLRLAGYNRPDHPYHEWLSMYGDASFIESTNRSIAIAERALAQANPTEREQAIRAYLTASYHEHEFFDQTWRIQNRY